MDIILGVRVQDATLVATSKAFTRGISVLKDSDDKTRPLNAHNLMAFTGESGDTVQFAEYIQANIQLYSMRENDIELSPKATASLLEINWPLPSDQENRTNLNWIDYLGTQTELPYGAHGYAAFYCVSLFDRHYRPDMSVEEGKELLRMSLAELQKRMPIEFKGLNKHLQISDDDNTIGSFLVKLHETATSDNRDKEGFVAFKEEVAKNGGDEFPSDFLRAVYDAIMEREGE
ncbi:hypothetical protein CJJ09_003736 [Candidozyma auris]|nr:hypothetical protein CJJ09_003736 [[Candida] auris]